MQSQKRERAGGGREGGREGGGEGGRGDGGGEGHNIHKICWKPGVIHSYK